MRKAKEISSPNSCWNRAHEKEMVFVLLGRDAAAPIAIRAWIVERVRLGINRFEDRQIVEAENVAKLMEKEGAKARIA
jgi:hypothetical protein